MDFELGGDTGYTRFTSSSGEPRRDNVRVGASSHMAEPVPLTYYSGQLGHCAWTLSHVGPMRQWLLPRDNLVSHLFLLLHDDGDELPTIMILEYN